MFQLQKIEPIPEEKGIEQLWSIFPNESVRVQFLFVLH